MSDSNRTDSATIVDLTSRYPTTDPEIVEALIRVAVEELGAAGVPASDVDWLAARRVAIALDRMTVGHPWR